MIQTKRNEKNKVKAFYDINERYVCLGKKN